MDKYWFKRIEWKIFKFLFPHKILLKERLPEGGVMIVCNHLRGVDGCYLHGIHLTDIYFLSKKELFDKKFIGWVLKKHNGLSIDRDNPSLQSLMQSIRILKDGHKLVVFPEGTRNKENTNIQQLKSGAGTMAIMAKKPILPVIIYDREKVFKKAYLMCGEPIYLDAYYGKKLTDEDQKTVNDIIRNAMIKTQLELDEYMYAKTGKKIVRDYGDK